MENGLGGPSRNLVNFQLKSNSKFEISTETRVFPKHCRERPCSLLTCCSTASRYVCISLTYNIDISIDRNTCLCVFYRGFKPSTCKAHRVLPYNGPLNRPWNVPNASFIEVLSRRHAKYTVFCRRK